MALEASGDFYVQKTNISDDKYCTFFLTSSCQVMHMEEKDMWRPEVLTHMWGPTRPGWTRSITLLLMLWLLALLGHPWYWLCKMLRSLSYTRMDFNYMSVRNDKNCTYMFMFLLKTLASKRLININKLLAYRPNCCMSFFTLYSHCQL